MINRVSFGSVSIILPTVLEFSTSESKSMNHSILLPVLSRIHSATRKTTRLIPQVVGYNRISQRRLSMYLKLESEAICAAL